MSVGVQTRGCVWAECPRCISWPVQASKRLVWWLYRSRDASRLVWAYQSIEDESICKLGKLIECILECATSSLHQLHALVNTGHSVVGGGQGVEWVGLVWSSFHCLAQVINHWVQVHYILSLKAHLTNKGTYMYTLEGLYIYMHNYKSTEVQTLSAYICTSFTKPCLSQEGVGQWG